MTLDDLHHLLEYHYWARDRILDAVTPLTDDQYRRNLSSSFPSIHQTLVHTYSAEWVWHSRWEGRPPKAMLPPDMFPDVASLRPAWIELEPRMHALLAASRPEGHTRRFDYTLLSGAPGSSTLQQMVQHVVNHATYHRGQVTTMLRQLGAEPPKSMDLIQFWREWDSRHAQHRDART